ncbi:hypothetical protein FIBSPDRAFT_554 [Athelia psychrophila]|uniref:F-box domain-containing protein n=1 Tax=Athelia psychrophila TaxID=1759441 RepID=A0A166WVS2_9AGAM|nr:hypothetical protein FIBSPDRAFT_554 [Fibularhizoctonia sp. CBS 109695]
MKCRKCNQLDLVFHPELFIPCPPPPDELILSHSTPTDLQREDAQRFQLYITGRLYQIDEHMTHLQQIEEAILEEQGRYKRQQQSLQASMCKYRCITAPVRSVPDDVLSLIFFTYVNAEDGHDAMLLAGVSKRWRAICLSSPSLWSRIYICDFGPAKDDFVHQAKAKFNLFSARSGTCTLNVKVDIHIEKNPNLIGFALAGYLSEEEERLRLLVDTIAPSAARWRILVIKCPWKSMLQMQHALAACTLPMLESLVIRVDKGPQELGASDSLEMFATAPRLRRVSLNFINCSPPRPSMRMPWEQLERLDGCFQSVEIFVAILRKSPNLIRCDNIFFRTGSGGSGARAHLPNLRSLRVSFTSMDELQQLLNLLDLPSLLHLYIYFVGANGQLLADAATLFEQSLCQFLDRSACRLQTFVAGHGFLDGNYVVQALSQQVFEAPVGSGASASPASATSILTPPP